MLSLVLVCWQLARQLVRLVRPLPHCASHGIPDDVTSGTEIANLNPNQSTVASDFNQEASWNATHGKQSVYTMCENNDDEEDDESELISDIKHRWLHENRKATEENKSDVRTAILQSPDPYDFVLVLVKRTHQGLKSLGRVALLELQSWSKMSPECRLQLTPSHKQTAAFVGIDCGPKLFELIRDVFELSGEDPSLYEPCVRRAIQSGKWKEAATCVAILQMQSLFSVQEILLPLVLTDKPAVIERYLDGHRDVQTSFLEMLDDLSSFDTDLRDVSRSVQVAKTKVTKKQLQKMAGRLAQLYGMNLGHCPNLLMLKNEKLLRGFLYGKYVKKKAGNWDELIEGCVRESPDLQLQLVRELVRYKDLPAAAQIAWKFHLDPSQLPCLVQTELWRHSDLDARQCREFESAGGKSGTSADFHQLPLPFSSIHLVDNVSDFQFCMAAILKPNNVVGVDSEWRPAVGEMGCMELGLLQLATKSEVFLLDMAVLPQLVPDEIFITFAERVFSSDEVLTLGYAIAGDLEVLASACPCMYDSLTRPQRIVDLMSFSETLDQLEEETTEASLNDEEFHQNHVENGRTTTRGLSKLIQKYLGKPLDKSNQISDWGMRPLRHDQIVYAALDAYCLLDAYHVMKERAVQLAHTLDIDIDVEPEMPLMKWLQPKRANTFHVSQPRSIINPPPRFGPPLTPTQFHVVVDSMLSGLGRQLRCCGVDVRIITHIENHSQAAKISRMENRIILTSGAPFHALRLQVAVGFCYCVMSSGVRDQVVEVLKHFNVRVTEKDIFSRCQVCNSNRYVRLAAKDVKKLLMLHRPDKFSETDIQCNQTEPTNSDDQDDLLPGDDVSTIQLGHGLTVRDGAAFIDSTGTQLLLDTIPVAKTGQVQCFFGCTNCGKVFWQGKHFEQIREQFSHVLS